MVHAIIAGALRQRLILLVIAVVLVGFGINAAKHLSVDAFPDVEIGRASCRERV